MKRTQTRQVHVGQVAIGGGAPITIQSMTNTDTRDPVATIAQIREKVGDGKVLCAPWWMQAARSSAAPCRIWRRPGL